MKFQLSPELIDKLKKQDVRIRNSFKKALDVFFKDPDNLELDNHKLKREWEGFRSINVTADLRAIYQEDKQSFSTNKEGNEPVAYFVALGTHKELFKK